MLMLILQRAQPPRRGRTRVPPTAACGMMTHPLVPPERMGTTSRTGLQPHPLHLSRQQHMKPELKRATRAAPQMQRPRQVLGGAMQQRMEQQLTWSLKNRSVPAASERCLCQTMFTGAASSRSPASSTGFTGQACLVSAQRPRATSLAYSREILNLGLSARLGLRSAALALLGES